MEALSYPQQLKSKASVIRVRLCFRVGGFTMSKLYVHKEKVDGWKIQPSYSPNDYDFEFIPIDPMDEDSATNTREEAVAALKRNINQLLDGFDGEYISLHPVKITRQRVDVEDLSEEFLNSYEIVDF